MKKSKKLKIQNCLLVIKQKKINKISNPLGYLYFPARRMFRRYEELKYTDTHTHTHTHTHTYIHENKNHQNQLIYTYIAIQHLFEHFFSEIFLHRYKASSMRKQYMMSVSCKIIMLLFFIINKA